MKFEVVLTDPFVVDSKSEVFKLWLDCVAKDEAVDRLLASYFASSAWPAIAKQHEAQLKVLFDSDTTDQYRMFGVLERYLQEPLRLRTQHVCYLNSQTQRVLIRNYYHLDQRRILDLLKAFRELRAPGGKLQPRTKIGRARPYAAAAQFSSAGNGRSPLDRQLDNVHRVYAALKARLPSSSSSGTGAGVGASGSGSGSGGGGGGSAASASSSPGRHAGILRQIQEEFCLSPDVAADYTHLIFFIHHNITVVRREGLREKAIVAWSGLKEIASAIMHSWCGDLTSSSVDFRTSSDKPVLDRSTSADGDAIGTTSGNGNELAAHARPASVGHSGEDPDTLHLELRDSFCVGVPAAAWRIRDMVTRSAKLAPGKKRDRRRKTFIRTKLKALQAARPQHVDRVVELVLKVAMNFSKSRKHLPSLLLEMHKISELLAQAQVPGGTAQFFRSLSLDEDESEIAADTSAAATSMTRAGTPDAQSPALSSRGSATRVLDERHTLENQEWANFLQVVEAGIRAIRQHPETVPE